jgi:2,5-diketo-D-gluconate reductase B
MQTIQLPNLSVPALGFGTWPLKGDDCRRAVADALTAGYRHIDTARMYANEEAVGQGLADSGLPRESIFLTTKLWHSELTRPQVLDATHDSLKKLGTDYVDLLLIHWPDPAVRLRETLEAMQELRAAGKVKHLGVSNFPPALMQEARQIAPVVCNQVEYHPYLNQDPLLRLCRETGTVLTAYAPTAHGKVLEEPVLREIGEKYGKSPVQVGLRWLIQQPNVAAIPKAASPEHRRSNFAIFDFALNSEEMATISALTGNLRLVQPSWKHEW